MSSYFNCSDCGRKVHFNQKNLSQNKRLLQSKRSCKELLITLLRSRVLIQLWFYKNIFKEDFNRLPAGNTYLSWIGYQKKIL